MPDQPQPVRLADRQIFVVELSPVRDSIPHNRRATVWSHAGADSETLFEAACERIKANEPSFEPGDWRFLTSSNVTNQMRGR